MMAEVLDITNLIRVSNQTCADFELLLQNLEGKKMKRTFPLLDCLSGQAPCSGLLETLWRSKSLDRDPGEQGRR